MYRDRKNLGLNFAQEVIEIIGVCTFNHQSSPNLTTIFIYARNRSNSIFGCLGKRHVRYKSKFSNQIVLGPSYYHTINSFSILRMKRL